MQRDFDINHRLDITNEVCPMTFVKTKLMLEKMQTGEILEVRLTDGEALENVPRSVREQGDTVLSLYKSNNDTDYHLIIKKGNNESAGIF